MNTLVPASVAHDNGAYVMYRPVITGKFPRFCQGLFAVLRFKCPFAGRKCRFASLKLNINSGMRDTVKPIWFVCVFFAFPERRHDEDGKCNYLV